MADTIADVAIPKGAWTDLYTATSITVGAAVDIYNKGSYPCLIAIAATAPESTTIGIPLWSGAVGNFCTVSTGESGLWAYCTDGTTSLSVQET